MAAVLVHALTPREQDQRAAVETTDDADSDIGVADLLPSAAGDPYQAALREVLLAEIGAALRELPPGQREVFVAHELEGLSFRELAARTGTSLNTLLSRKRYATQFLRERLQAVWDDWLMT